jgi:hypothetical protein
MVNEGELFRKLDVTQEEEAERTGRKPFEDPPFLRP